MKIADIGGEFELIKRLNKTVNDPDVIKGIGDDCAVLEHTKGRYLLVTTDMMVENDHFSLKWSTPYQVGKKLMEVNVSDIVAMGGKPTYAFISMSIKKDTKVKFMEDLYKGLYDSAEKHGVLIIGGDTTHGSEYVFNLALLGVVEKSLLRLRAGAKAGDLICVTGKLGGSKAGLELLSRAKGEDFKLLYEQKNKLQDYLEPVSRTAEEAKIIARYADAMIDVSDGLGSEVRHICEESDAGAEIYYEKIPLSKQTIDSAKELCMDAHDFALYGGEDFELVFTIKEENLKTLEKEFSDFTVVGKIAGKEKGIFIQRENNKSELKKGFDHFV